MALKTSITARISATLQTILDLVTSSAPLTRDLTLDLTSGTGANQADKIFSDTRTLSASATEDLDLAGSLTDALGAALTFVKVKAIIIIAAAANVNDVVVGGASANQFVGPFGAGTHTVKVPPGGFLVLAAPGAAGLGTVTAGTGDLLKVANSAGGSSVTYDVIVIGTSA